MVQLNLDFEAYETRRKGEGKEEEVTFNRLVGLSESVLYLHGLWEPSSLGLRPFGNLTNRENIHPINFIKMA